jgi:hypothetical protein
VDLAVEESPLLFHSPLSFVLFDTGTHLNCPMEESEQFVRPYGELGKYLHEYRHTSPGFMSPRKGFIGIYTSNTPGGLLMARNSGVSPNLATIHSGIPMAARSSLTVISQVVLGAALS